MSTEHAPGKDLATASATEWGTGTPSTGRGATADEIRDFCRDQIAHFKIPRYIKLVSEFPMTVTGKVQKFRMREMAIEELGLK